MEADVRNRGSGGSANSTLPTDGGQGWAAAQAQEWLSKWEMRSTSMDSFMQIICSRTQRIPTPGNTLSLMYSSAISRGLPQKLTRNPHTLSKCRRDWLSSTYGRPAAPRKPTAEPVRAKPKTLQKNKPELAWDLVREVIRMAEGRDQFTPGCAPPRKPKTRHNLEWASTVC